MPTASILRLVLVAALLLPLLALAPASRADEPTVEPILFASGHALTPDGHTIVFTWRRDLWVASATGGAARRLTYHPAKDGQARVSPDGSLVAFVSNRSGTDQVWVMPLAGGAPKRVTSNTEPCRLEDWFPDGTAVLVRQSRDHAWRRADRLFHRPLDFEAPATILFDANAYGARVSPDGRRIAFTREGVHWARKGYRGSQVAQLWIYDREAGTFDKISAGEHAERRPLWGPDGRHLYVTSDQDGTFNVWRHDLETGDRERVTAFEDDGVRGPTLSADGSVLVFARLASTWRLAPTAGTPAHEIELTNTGDRTVEPELRRVLKKASEVAFTEDAKEIAFVVGGDIWVMDTQLREPRRITRTPDEERDPLFSPDHSALYFVRDTDAQPDIWVARREDPARWWWQNDAFQLEQVTDDAEAEGGLSFTPDGGRIAYLSGRGLWTMKPDGTEPLHLVDSWNAPQYSFTPDGRWVAYAHEDENFNRDVWIRLADGSGEPCNVSRHPDDDGSPAFSPDGKLLAFAGRRWNDERDVCYVWLREADEDRTKRDRTLEKAIKAMKGRKKSGTPKKEPASAAKKAAVPSDVTGTWRGRVNGEELPPEGLAMTLVLVRDEDGQLSGTIDVETAHSGALDELVVENGRFRLTADTPLGKLEAEGTLEDTTIRGTWKIENGISGTLELEKEEEEETTEDEEEAPPEDTPKTGEDEAKKKEEKKGEKAPEPVEIDFEGIEDRIHRISIPNSSERGLLWSPDAKKLAFEATVGGASGLYTVEIPGDLKPKRLSTTRGRGGRWLPEAKKIAWLVSGVPGTLDGNGKSQTFSFEVRDVVDLGERYAAAFDQAWRIMRDAYYDSRLGGRDWNAIRAKYRPLAQLARAPEEIDAVVNMMLGELNGSHLGFGAGGSSWSPPGWRAETGHLGVRFDPSWDGEGLRVADVVPDSPADRNGTRIEPGEIVLSIDGQALRQGVNPDRLLTGDPKRHVHLRIRGAEGAERDVSMLPSNARGIRRLLYDVWLDRNEEMVERLGQGRLGYLHVRGMNWSSFQRFEEALYKAGHGRDGLILDVRDNGGGFTADHLLTSLTQPQHAFTVPRDGTPGYPQDRMVYARWTKPIAVLVNQNSFSNAEIFAHAVRTLGRGPIVGVPTAGGVISTGGTIIMDVGSLRIPFRGWFRLPDGEDMELNGCPPDHEVWITPEDETRGKDPQLEKAVDVLLRDVEAWASKGPPSPAYASKRAR